MPKQSRYLFDTVVLSNFALVDRLDLLIDRYGSRSCITTQTLDEISRGAATGRSKLVVVSDLVDAGRIKVEVLSNEERKCFQGLIRILGEGEASLIALAMHRGGTVVTDDRVARRFCQESGVPVTGTIGILLALIRAGTLSPLDADAILKAMIEQGFYSPVSRVSDVEQ